MGIAEDGVDFVGVWKFSGRRGIVETHTQLAPVAQWKNPTVPEPLAVPPSSYHLDTDEDGRVDHVFIQTAVDGGCERMIHFQWIKEQYVLIQGGKDHI
jgi:hypothetical protein